ncbi:MAG: NADH-quinone oxidoreductase subunit NuoN [Caulobacteraceae bacterium]|jgi:NADH-quinone oxidoreductase subunit N|nr:NADH-quinone oxidoreductase subunit NuoN [Caulobacteraceae bacterium]
MTFQSAAALARPELILIVSALALLVWGAFQSRASVAFTIAAMAALVAAAVASAIGPMGRAFSGGLIVDSGAVFSKVVIYLASALAVPLGERWFARRGMARFEYPVLVMLAALGMGMMVSAGDLISLYISIELQSLALYILAAFQRDDEKSSEAGLKYFVLGALSSGILLYGTSLVYGFAGSTRFEVIAQSMTHGAGVGALFGLIFVVCGIGFKVSAAPFHMWTPDVYEGAPTPVVGFFAGAPKLAAMVLLARILTQSFGGAVDQWRQVLVVMALLSVAVGAFAGLAQSNLKRLWAYSSIASIGYALVGLAAGGAAGIQSMLVYMVLYVVDVTGFFACLAALSRGGKAMETMADFAGLARERPAIALAMTVFSLSALGLPPMSGLWGKYYVFKAAAGAGLVWVAVAALVGSVVAAYYYLKLIKVMWLDPSPGATDAPPAEAVAITYATALFAFPAVLIALIVLDPAAQTAATSLALR